MFRSKQKSREMIHCQSESISKSTQSTPFGDIITERKTMEYPKGRIRFDKFPLELQVKNGVKINQVETKVLDGDFNSIVESETSVSRETLENNDEQPF